MYVDTCLLCGSVGTVKAEKDGPASLENVKIKGEYKTWEMRSLCSSPFVSHLQRGFSLVGGWREGCISSYPVFCSQPLSLPVFGHPGVIVSRILLVISEYGKIIVGQKGYYIMPISGFPFPPRHCDSFSCFGRDVLVDFRFHEGINQKANVVSLNHQMLEMSKGSLLPSSLWSEQWQVQHTSVVLNESPSWWPCMKI